MTETPTIAKAQKIASAKNMQIVAVALLGFALLLTVGFAPLEAIHNATHDTRHSTGFPCH